MPLQVENLMAYHQWKKHSLLLYDTLINQSLVHPSPCFRWGRVVAEEQTHTVQRIYYSERGANPNSVVIANVKLAKPRLSDPCKMDKFDEHSSSININVVTRLETPEKTEVNKLYTCQHAPNLLIAKSDLSKLHIWSLSEGGAPSPPIATLSGHGEQACESNFALDSSKGAPRVLSGDKDGLIFMWDIQSLVKDSQGGKDIGAQTKFEGHSDTIEDVCFRPSSADEFCSVGDDQLLLFWDHRSGTSPVLSVPKWCDVDLHCVDWNAADENLLVTGGADGGTFVFDRRKVEGQGGKASPLHELCEHKDAVFRVGWLPQSRTHFASGGDDSLVVVWDISRVGTHTQHTSHVEEEAGPPEIIFRHTGHRGSVQDLQWNPVDPWCIASVSEDASWAQGGGTLQIWRPVDYLYRTDEDCLAELSKLQADYRGAMEN
eukprot:CAMPEP_0206242778 /NCGR_PEP_ID=MMETSP0047_2-20121206/17240_1 /ASSEMBLY_ACC=CAM_ASM_000192 /TAXON_ID=195065 /ORGANISM="Chroomonas mesostigmatica_cf, Strain CCMP1168" /LENGTH=430 /DNA_ID=CAMNT_0053667823 /DNA_START=25 /DNA_END=1317 /DNA_ORIENTATION=+